MNKDPNRATQFLAFAALSGFERLLEEQKRTQEKAAEQNTCPAEEKNQQRSTNDPS